MTIITVDVRIGGGQPPSEDGRGKSYVLYAPYDVVNTSSGRTIVPVAKRTELGTDGTATVTVDALPADTPYVFQFEIDNGFWKSQPILAIVPASGTHKLADLVDLSGGFNPPAWYTDVLNAHSTIDETVAEIPTLVQTAVTDEMAGRDLVERGRRDPVAEAAWVWYVMYESGEIAFGQRTDGTFYPAYIGETFADRQLGPLAESQGWRFAIYYETGEVAFGQRNDGTWFPASLGGSGSAAKTVRISGDSITASWAAYAAALATSLGTDFQVIAQGNGGKRSEWVAARQGGQPLRVTVTGGSIPASGSVAVTVAAWNHIGTLPPIYASGTYAGVLGGVRGSLTITDETTGAATFARNAPGRVTPVPAGSPFARDEYRSAWQIAWAGRNNYVDLEQVVRDTRDMLAHALDKEHQLVYSILPWLGEESGSNVRAKLDATNAALRDAFPAQFVDIAARLRSEALLTAVGVAVTAEDTQNINAGLTPVSFRSDAGHLNAKGYEAVNLLTKEEFSARGWIS